MLVAARDERRGRSNNGHLMGFSRIKTASDEFLEHIRPQLRPREVSRARQLQTLGRIGHAGSRTKPPRRSESFVPKGQLYQSPGRGKERPFGTGRRKVRGSGFDCRALSPLPKCQSAIGSRR